MTTKLVVASFLSMTLAFSLCQRLDGEPMDSKAAQKLPEFRSIVREIKMGKLLTTQQIEFLREGLHSKNSVLTSIAAWCVGEIGKQGDSLVADLKGVTATNDSMVGAFIMLSKSRIELRDAPSAEKIVRYIQLANDNNPFLQVESAKMLAKVNRGQGKRVLAQLASEKHTAASNLANRQLRAMQIADGESAIAPLPSSDELYELVLSVVD